MVDESTINIVSINEMKRNTCGSCKHSDNEYGVVALHCQLIIDDFQNGIYSGECCDWGKVRSWDKCHFKENKWEPRA